MQTPGTVWVWIVNGSHRCLGHSKRYSSQSLYRSFYIVNKSFVIETRLVSGIFARNTPTCPLGGDNVSEIVCATPLE